MQINNKKNTSLRSSTSYFYFYSPIPLLWYARVSRRELFLLLLTSLLTRESLIYKIIVTCCSVSIICCVTSQPGHRLPYKLPASDGLLRCLLATPSAPQEQVTGTWMAKSVPCCNACSWMDYTYPYVVKGLSSSKPSNQQAHFDDKALGARLPLGAWAYPALYGHTLLRAFVQYCELFLGGKRGFEGWEKELGIAMLFLSVLGILPMQAAFHIVFSSSPLGQTLLFFIRRKDVVAHRPGGEGGCLCCLCCTHLWIL